MDWRNVASSLDPLLNLVKEQAQGSSEYCFHHCGFETKTLFVCVPVVKIGIRFSLLSSYRFGK